MHHVSRLIAAAYLLGIVGCAARPELPPVQPYSAAQLGSLRLRAVLIAGDATLSVFDRAVDGMVSYLAAHGVSQGSVTRLSASPSQISLDNVRSASRSHVLNAIEQMGGDPGQGCFVFATSHGARYRGLSLPAQEILSPEALDAALVRGCGNAPTMVVISGCYSGNFVQPPMTRDNRVILTASAADRASFGCGADNDLTFYDKCLLKNLEAGGTWDQLYRRVVSCVMAAEAGRKFTPSQPKEWIGPAVRELSLPTRLNQPSRGRV